MEETNTTDLSLNNMTEGDYAGSATAEEQCPPYNRLQPIEWIFIAVSLCGLVGNMVVIWFLGFQMKRNPFTVYVLNLAIADFVQVFCLIVILISRAVPVITCTFSFDFLLTDVIVRQVFVFWYFASMYLLSAMSLERCLCALFPIWYRCHRPKRLSGIVCGVIWALVVLFCCLFYICRHFPWGRTCVKISQAVSIFKFIIFSLFPLLSNFALFIKLRCGSQRRHPGRLYVAVLLSVVFLFIFGFPLTVELFLDSIFPSYTLHLFYLLASLNSTINPLIYFLVGSCRQCRFQGSLMVALRRVFEDKTTSEERRNVSGEPMGQTSL
ncbi:proto-oncogene Mas-like [Calypte anna]|uniref:proto-oncogene Mas-like n=1 Tax=Calypte anna TaxID=9244 RepID=UPI0011C490B3|nr:proto-oncogene Mas-like [Calypte anna]